MEPKPPFFDPWKGVGYDPANPFAAFPDAAPPQRIRQRELDPEVTITAESTTVDPPNRFGWTQAMLACPARVKVGCGCQTHHECRARELAPVTPEDCRRCLESRGG